jgi:uncharacterized protein (DUF58 family)
LSLWQRFRTTGRLLLGDGEDAPLPAPSDPVAPGGVPREVLRQVRLIELRTRGSVNSLFSGEYHSAFKGQGMEFSEVRAYEPGDDVRSIDWNVTARMGHPYIKKYIEERELTVMVLVDFSGSERFGTRGRLKAELAAELAAVLALSAVRNNDRVGLLLFTDRVEHVVPPKKGRRHVLRLIRDLLVFRPARRGTDIAGALEYAARMLRQRSILFLLSDFQLPASAGQASPAAPLATLQKTLRLVANRHDIVAIRTVDTAEETMPDAGLLVLRDPETGDEVVLDTRSRVVRRRYEARAEAEAAALRTMFRRLAVDEIEVRTDRSYVRPLLAFFQARERRLAR